MKPTNEFPGYKALRIGRRSQPQRIYLITFVTHRRRRYFGHHHVAHAVARELDGRHLWRSHAVHAWVLMPDHVHVLCELADDENLPHLVTRIKSVTSRLANSVLGSSGAFWARGYHDHVLRTQEELGRAAQYLVANPVRAGLVEDPWQWPYWNSRWIETFDDLLTFGT